MSGVFLFIGDINMSIRATSNMLPTVKSFDLISSGAIAWATTVKKFGYFDNVTNLCSLWDIGELYEYLDTAQKVQVASSSNTDAIDGDGAREIAIYGLDENGIGYGEIVSLNGQTPVETEGSFIRVFRMEVLSVGINQSADGNIQCGLPPFTGGEAATVLAQITGSNNQTLMAIFTIPADKVGFIHEYYSNSGKSGEVVIDSVSRVNGSVFQLDRRILLFESSFNYQNEIPFFFPPLTDIEIRAQSNVGCPVSAGFDIVLIDKDKLFS